MTFKAALVKFLTYHLKTYPKNMTVIFSEIVDFTKTLVSRFGDRMTGKFTVSIQKVHFQ